MSARSNPAQANIQARAGSTNAPQEDRLKAALAEEVAARQQKVPVGRFSGFPGTLGPSESQSALDAIDANIDRKLDIGRTGVDPAKGKATLRQTTSRGSVVSKGSQGSGSKDDPAYVFSDSEDDVLALSDTDLPGNLRRKPAAPLRSPAVPIDTPVAFSRAQHRRWAPPEALARSSLLSKRDRRSSDPSSPRWLGWGRFVRSRERVPSLHGLRTRRQPRSDPLSTGR